MSLGPLELALIVLAVTLIFGAKKVPDLMRGFGRGVREFKSEVKQLQQDIVLEPVRSIHSSAERAVPQHAQAAHVPPD